MYKYNHVYYVLCMVGMNICLYVCMYLYNVMYVCMYACMYVFILC